ncbi:tRNA splicing endonuclease [Halalkaliarchaeum sp. AArc-CO]|uniref:tRNA-intron lyase n=1 Tax=unclassified Halalkaliarchaeum TaxID=2678344 RepID=UPI00217E0E33|nr:MULTISPECIES: tRNA-intron lyase [unclassified Halalkaliarchaeum]MDR5671951.1 tRNA-intron lyase [Halalkaliarchaeum sp. AArc-GB]UWG51457.1 tRNA splicing endonuclease [Halalkaliarchaeum sp. AArc-CO]
MHIEGTLRGEEVRVGGDARQRFYDARGYGRPLGGNEIALSRVEAAHLLFRGDLDEVTVDGRSMTFEEFFVDAAAAGDRFALRFLVYADLRERGFYLSPVREGWPGERAVDPDAPGRVDFAVYDRGEGPPDGSVAYRVRVVGERERLPAAELSGVLAIVDEESDLTYFETGAPAMDGSTTHDPPASVDGVLLEDRVVVWDAPDSLYERGFYGQPLSGRTGPVEDALQLSLVEAASLAAEGVLSLSSVIGGDSSGDDVPALASIVERGRAVEGERFDRRLRVYRQLRDAGIVPKTGFKFGADFRTYANVESVEELPHSETLVRVLSPDHVFDPRELSLDVRLAGGVRKRMVFALTDGSTVEYRSVARLTP